MIIKDASPRQKDLEALRALLQYPAIGADTQRKIEQEIRNIQAGERGESEAAYEIGFHYGESRNWAIIHDLRLEYKGRVAQIDHLLINRVLDIWVCESKRFSEGIGINEQGECVMFWQGRPQGIGSPHEQNEKHLAVLKAVFDDGKVTLPTRLGFQIKPSLNSLVVVSKNARIARPKTPGWWQEGIVKADQIKARIDKAFDKDTNALTMAKLVGSDTLANLARELASLHRPISFDWPARFGLPSSPPVVQVEQAPQPPAPPPDTPPEVPQGDPAASKKSKLVCHACGVSVEYRVARFCWFQKPRFGGNVYCQDCQASVPKTVATSE